MRLADSVSSENDVWLKELLKDREDDVLKLYLVYDDKKFGPDSARDIWNKVAGEDFVAQEDTGVLSNESLTAGVHQGMVHVAPKVPGSEEHHWWLEIFVDEDLTEYF